MCRRARLAVNDRTFGRAPASLRSASRVYNNRGGEESGKAHRTWGGADPEGLSGAKALGPAKPSKMAV